MNYRILILAFLAFLIYFANLGSSSIYILDEAKNAGCAMEMYQRNDLIVPTFNGVLRTDKPPVHYFFMIASYQFFGITAFAARLFSALAGLTLIIFLYKQIARNINESIAFYTCLIFLSSLQLAVQFHLAVPDPYLILWMTICFFSFYNGYRHTNKSIYWMYIAAALGFMTKGLIAIVFPGIVFLLYLIFTQNLKWVELKKLRIPQGALLFLVIATPWYWMVSNATDGQWLRGFFIDHNLDRYTSTMEGHRGFPLAPFAIMIGALLPFSVFAIQAISLAWKNRKENSLLLYSLIIVLVIGVFFSFSKTILPSYPAPALPFLALILGYYLNHIAESTQSFKRSIHISFFINLLICLAVPIAIYFALQQEASITSLTPLAWPFLILPIGSITGWYLFAQKKKRLFIYTWSGSWIAIILIFFYYAYPQVDLKNPVKESLPLLTSNYNNHMLVAYKQFNPAYVFNLHKTVQVIDSDEQLRSFTESSAKAVIITRAKHLDDFNEHSEFKVIYRGRDLFEGSETVLLAN